MVEYRVRYSRRRYWITDDREPPAPSDIALTAAGVAESIEQRSGRAIPEEAHRVLARLARGIGADTTLVISGRLLDDTIGCGALAGISTRFRCGS